jgi:hypothetical protein
MVQYATAEELATHLGYTVDTARADQLLTQASARFSVAADTWFEEQAATYTAPGTGARALRLPHKPIQAVTLVAINDTAVDDYTRINQTLYRTAGFGTCGARPPDEIVVEYSHGHDAPPDDVIGVVLDMAGQAYEVAAGLTAEQIDDYSVRYAAGVGEVVALTASAADLAEHYRGVFAA